MYRDYDSEIGLLKETIHRKNKLNELLKKTEHDLIQEKLKLNQLLIQLHKESWEVERLELKNITTLFYEILGNKEEQIKKEKQDVLKAKLRYDQCKRNVEYLVSETKRLVYELSQTDNCEEKYESLIQKKLKDMSQEEILKGEAIKKLILRKESMSKNLIELTEAVAAGEEALENVENTIKSLERASSWGVWDMFGGGIITTMVKYDHINDAKQYVEQTQMLLGKFKRELSDVTMVTSPQISIGAFETFADHFFDGLIFDWVVQSEIGKSLDSVKNIKNQIDRIMSKLYEEKVTEEFLIQQLEEQIKNEIEKA